MSIKVVVALGSEWSRVVSYGETITEEEADIMGGSINTFEFKTEAEAEAFKKGLEAAEGWHDTYVLDEEEQERYRDLI